MILGGTLFLGRHTAEAALARGHRVTVFHRGRTNPDMHGVTHLIGDRYGDLTALGSGTWDAVVDCSGQHPRAVRDAATLLAGRAGHYGFVSTLSVYRDNGTPAQAEDGPLHDPAPDEAEVSSENYSALKVACEDEARAAFADRCCVSRPGLIVGPWDPTERFTWWARRLARGGRVPVPGPPDRPIQLIDARDHADWLLDTAEGGLTGTFNLVRDTTMGAIVHAFPHAQPVWVDDDVLLELGIGIWMEVPLWIPIAGEYAGFHRFDTAAARGAGLRCRDLAQTCADTAAWAALHPPREGAGTGLTAEREAAILQAAG